MTTSSWRSWRWWFENRHTGRVTIAQIPNWPIWCIGVGWLARLALTDGSTAHDIVGWMIRGLWLTWGADELIRGVNPWRRLLGATVIAWQVISIVAIVA